MMMMQDHRLHCTVFVLPTRKAGRPPNSNQASTDIRLDASFNHLFEPIMIKIQKEYKANQTKMNQKRKEEGTMQCQQSFLSIQLKPGLVHGHDHHPPASS